MRQVTLPDGYHERTAPKHRGPLPRSMRWHGREGAICARYLLFSGLAFNAGGGWLDFKRDFGDLDTALEAAGQIEGEWVQIVDTLTMKLIHQSGEPGGAPTRNDFGPHAA